MRRTLKARMRTKTKTRTEVAAAAQRPRTRIVLALAGWAQGTRAPSPIRRSDAKRSRQPAHVLRGSRIKPARLRAPAPGWAFVGGLGQAPSESQPDTSRQAAQPDRDGARFCRQGDLAAAMQEFEASLRRSPQIRERSEDVEEPRPEIKTGSSRAGCGGAARARPRSRPGHPASTTPGPGSAGGAGAPGAAMPPGCAHSKGTRPPPRAIEETRSWRRHWPAAEEQGTEHPGPRGAALRPHRAPTPALPDLCTDRSSGLRQLRAPHSAPGGGQRRPSRKKALALRLGLLRSSVDRPNLLTSSY
jgi:hypothetical protein